MYQAFAGYELNDLL